MQEFSKSHKARRAIRTFKVLADALAVRGYYKPSGKTGQKLAEALKLFSPEIYGSMSDSRISELNGLEYVIDRLPKGIEKCNKIILTAQEDFENTPFEKIIPPKRRRECYRVSEKEMCFVVTRGLTEIYDILTHLTFLNIEAQKLYQQIGGDDDGKTLEWQELEKIIQAPSTTERGTELDQAIWNCSILIGRTYKETKKTYENVEENRQKGHNSGFFNILFNLGHRIFLEKSMKDEQLVIYFTPSLLEMIDHHKYAAAWASNVKNKLVALGLNTRPIHLISANMHSVKNSLYGAGALKNAGSDCEEDFYSMILQLKNQTALVDDYAEKHGLVLVKDESGSNIDVQIIDVDKIELNEVRKEIDLSFEKIHAEKPVIIVMDYAFGTQAFQVLDELLNPYMLGEQMTSLSFASISIMGKAGILPGKKGDIMLATAHVMEGTPHNYIVENDLRLSDFDSTAMVYCGPMVTVLGTSLQNKDVLERFHRSSWKAIGLEMEGAHYQRAISAAVIQDHVGSDLKLRYAYYASDNPLQSGQTLASGPMGDEGVTPTYMITKVVLRKILQSE